ncbi:Hypothetical protein HVR_LOCUS561 [uncultured virus]|nr:Hypothetical protein HVR_LOCUS561 [uncultured virus]
MAERKETINNEDDNCKSSAEKWPGDISDSASNNSEWFEWKDGDHYQDRVGYFVSLINGKLVIATNAFNVLGVTVEEKKSKKGWAKVALLGKVYVKDNGNCQTGGKCTFENGIAVPGTKWFVMKRISNHIIEIVYK